VAGVFVHCDSLRLVRRMNGIVLPFILATIALWNLSGLRHTGGRGLVCFHDWLCSTRQPQLRPRPTDTLRSLRYIQLSLDGVNCQPIPCTPAAGVQH
jgi:hypothetical protein